MQSVVRSSFVGLLAIASLTAGLTACGDKVTNVGGSGSDTTIHVVTVTPQVVTNLAVGGSFTLAASVDAGSAATNRTVTWSSSDATIASVDAATGKVTGVKVGGPVTITAAAVSNPQVKGAAVVTVVPVGGGAVPLVTISTINMTNGVTSVPATLTNVANQIDVTLNVDANGSALSKITGMVKCGNDSVQVIQSIASGNVSVSADEAAAPVTMSFNTAAFNSTTGVPSLHNGQCTVSAFVTTTGGTQSASTSTSFTLNNLDMAVVTVSTTNAATDNINRPWIGGGPLTISALPVMYSGRTPVAATIGFNTGAPLTNVTTPLQTTQTLTSLSSGVFSATWTNGPTAPSVQNWASLGVTPTVNISDNSGASTGGLIGLVTVKGGTITNTPANGAFNFDDQKPAPGSFSVLNNPDQNIVPPNSQGYVGSLFRFAGDSAAGYRGPDFIAGNETRNLDNGGVDKVAVTFQFANNTTGAAFTTVTNTTPITESVASTSYKLRMITADALGNADTTGNASSPQAVVTFGVDKTAPVNTFPTAPANQATAVVANGNGNYVFGITDNLSGPGPALVAQVRNWNGLTSVSSANEGNINTNVLPPVGSGLTYHAVGFSATGTQQPCYIGRFNATAAAAGANAIAVLSSTGAALGFCTPVVYNLASNTTLPTSQGVDGYWFTTVVATDVAGNQAAPFTRVVLEDQTAPTVNNIDLPPTATGNATVSFPAAVSDNASASVGDIVSSWITQTFKTTALGGANGTQFQWPAQAGPGVAFDNVLTNATTVTPSISNFAKNIQLVGPAAASVAPVVAGNDSAVTVTVAGAASTGPLVNTGSLSAIFQTGLPQLVAGSSTTWPNGLVNGWAIAGSNTTLTDCPTAGCTGNAAAVNPLSTVLTATAIGAPAIFANPLTGGAVTFWYRPSASTGTWFFAGTAGSGQARDTGVGGNRFWDFTASFTPPKTAPDGTVLTGGTTITVIAVGVNAAGDAIITSTPQTLTLTNP